MRNLENYGFDSSNDINLSSHHHSKGGFFSKTIKFISVTTICLVVFAGVAYTSAKFSAKILNKEKEFAQIVSNLKTSIALPEKGEQQTAFDVENQSGISRIYKNSSSVYLVELYKQSNYASKLGNLIATIQDDFAEIYPLNKIAHKNTEDFNINFKNQSRLVNNEAINDDVNVKLAEHIKVVKSKKDNKLF